MDTAMQELVRQAEAHAKRLENGTGGSAKSTCSAHGELATGVAASLRLLVVIARRDCDPPRRITWAGIGTAIGAAAASAAAALFGKHGG